MTQLWLFFLVVLAVVVLPGMDMAYIAGSSLVGGRRQGLLALTGVVAGGICHVLAAALGIGLLLQLVPGLFNAVLLIGAAYLAWIAWTLLRSRDAAALQADAPRLSPRAAVLRGALTSLLNPKAYLFMLAVFPQFIDPQRGPVWMQALVLWLIIAATQALVYGPLAPRRRRCATGFRSGPPRACGSIARSASCCLRRRCGPRPWVGAAAKVQSLRG